MHACFHYSIFEREKKTFKRVTHYKQGFGIVSRVTIGWSLDALLFVVHDQLDSVPERQRVAEEDDEPDETSADSGEHTSEDSGTASED